MVCDRPGVGVTVLLALPVVAGPSSLAFAPNPVAVVANDLRAAEIGDLRKKVELFVNLLWTSEKGKIGFGAS